MSDAGARPIAPSSKLALYLAAVISLYVTRDQATVIIAAVALIMIAIVTLRSAPRPVPRARWKAAIVFITWVLVMRVALDLVTGVPLDDHEMWLTAGRQAGRVAVLGVGVIVLIAMTTARDIVDELEHSRLPRTARLLVMMLVQYPRVLRDRFDQIVEAQVARGADRPRTVVQRVSHGASLMLPVMQSELNAIGERAALIHLRGLDLEVRKSPETAPRTGRDVAALSLAAAMVIAAVIFRILTR
jgi:hypothetical protein